MKVEVNTISTDRAPRAIGPYSQAVSAGGVMYLSGQVALDAKGEAQGVTADDRAMFTETVGIFQFTHVGTGFTLDGVHEQLEYLVTIIPGHILLPFLEL